jgi:2-polyprenyl-3-methyl-5-hydroxy-6-metoxy-1,4-benzoquinol methylase
MGEAQSPTPRSGRLAVEHPMTIASLDTLASGDVALGRIVRAYDDPVVRAYCRVRFMILRQRFLFEIGQYLPRSGRVLDVGCGFGLFALYFAIRIPTIHVQGFDLSEYRVQLARRAAEKLGVENVEFHVGDATDLRIEHPIAAAYMLDLIHHIPERSVRPLVAAIAANLGVGGRLVLKDIESSRSYKLVFTWLLDKLMDYRAPVRYWAPEEVQSMLESLGFEVFRHRMIDYLPYPHILYVSSFHAP